MSYPSNRERSMNCQRTAVVRFALCLLVTVSMVTNGCGGSSSPPARKTERVSPAKSESKSIAGDGRALRISGPYLHRNLSVFLFHGEDSTTDEFITLREGLESGKVVLSEKGSERRIASSDRNSSSGSRLEREVERLAYQNRVRGNSGAVVNTLMVDNRGDRPVYIQAGDIVKGGRQDRTIGVDIVIVPHSGNVPLAAFCVEQGRWAYRDGVARGGGFSLSTQYVSSKELKLAVRHSKNQRDVWKKVRDVQVALSKSLSTDIYSAASPSSLQLALENKTLRVNVDAYLVELEGLVGKYDDVIGYAFAINGKLNSADVYASSSLFRKLWPKLLESSSTEAIAHLNGKEAKEACTIAHVTSCLREAERGKPVVRDLEGGLGSVARESEKSYLFETRRDGVSLRKNYLAK